MDGDLQFSAAANARLPSVSYLSRSDLAVTLVQIVWHCVHLAGTLGGGVVGRRQRAKL